MHEIGTVDAVLLALLLGAHGYLWWRLVRGTTRPGAHRRRLAVLLVVLALLLTFAVVVPYPPAWLVPLQWAGFVWLGLVFYAVLALLVLEPLRPAVRWWQRRQVAVPAHVGAPAPADEAGQQPEPETRRLFLARAIAAAACTAAAGVAGYGAWEAGRAPVVRRLPVTLAGLDPALDGLRLVAFSDVHVSSRYRGRRLERVIELVNAQRPHVVAIVGDLVDGASDRVREELAPLADLESEYGVFFVTGNHEYLVDTQHVLEQLDALGIRTLRNERVAIGRGGATFDLAGVDDVSGAGSGLPGHGADLRAALGGRDASTPVVLLAHEPSLIDQARAAGVDLQLSGHTHGGQLWPFDHVVRWGQPAVEGYSRHGRTRLYVSSGIGFWGPPMRVGARPEIVLVELRSR